MSNRQILLADLPQGRLGHEHFVFRERDRPRPAEGEVVLRTLYISLDAASRAWMQGATYRPVLKAGDVMAGAALAEVVESRTSQLAVGDLVFAETGWQSYAAVPARNLVKLPRSDPLTHLVSVYGVPGLTAYFGLLECARLKAGQTVVISAAAGAVGSIAGQIAKIKGCRTVGITGGAIKCDLIIREFGFDASIDYKAGNTADRLRTICADGIDVYFDNTGGDILDACLLNMARYGRIVCCGAVSLYDREASGAGQQGVPGLVILKSLTMKGFLLADYLDQRDRAIADLKRWVDSGQLAVHEDVIDGFDCLPSALIGLLRGENIGKRMVRVA
ncbi:NADP-dependent oxidoreductase [Burkholderia pseudomallei]|uniref:NADP-dependent oxidoreductase n=1 Tax=Burkholderia pseudomallei TaxID=28450 RepID=UPI002DBD3A0D|nr:NADP-dependent oxidoreductase [Burkholderia pseudomallei]MEB5485035.1 NADP-dependent oxidoreductase [Burkholderia pseudomallei]MEB5491774.1 NADP-dependent oxidoreductase [Burkholderia pseudomallei]MEB5498584.1 NADP-dependent oxidoreductase [Burkholderia pseudomallei]MEB5503748.1 NADP-dependent oxidoreductase [Burkholderia pseudomallei]MEB5511521.1 NADP-dependent oxidoreductase [Burkholderia pseudomallei]